MAAFEQQQRVGTARVVYPQHRAGHRVEPRRTDGGDEDTAKERGITKSRRRNASELREQVYHRTMCCPVHPGTLTRAARRWHPSR